MVVLMENTSYEGVVGNSQMPFVNGLVSAYGSVSTTDLSHPSLPNYLGYVSGSIQNNPQDTTPQDGTYPGPQFTDELASAGIAWKAYMQDMPVACDLTDQYGPGSYDVNHNPFMYFNSVRNNASQCNRDVPYPQLTADLSAGTAPAFIWVTPNTTNDMHDGTPAQGDAFLKALVTQVQASSWWTAQSRIVITWDEGTQSEQVLTLVVGSAHGTAASRRQRVRNAARTGGGLRSRAARATRRTPTSATSRRSWLEQHLPDPAACEPDLATHLRLQPLPHTHAASSSPTRISVPSHSRSPAPLPLPVTLASTPHLSPLATLQRLRPRRVREGLEPGRFRHDRRRPASTR